MLLNNKRKREYSSTNKFYYFNCLIYFVFIPVNPAKHPQKVNVSTFTAKAGAPDHLAPD